MGISITKIWQNCQFWGTVIPYKNLFKGTVLGRGWGGDGSCKESGEGESGWCFWPRGAFMACDWSFWRIAASKFIVAGAGV